MPFLHPFMFFKFCPSRSTAEWVSFQTNETGLCKLSSPFSLWASMTARMITSCILITSFQPPLSESMPYTRIIYLPANFLPLTSLKWEKILSSLHLHDCDILILELLSLGTRLDHVAHMFTSLLHHCLLYFSPTVKKTADVTAASARHFMINYLYSYVFCCVVIVCCKRMI